MRSRRQHAEEHENHERWLVSYADFITLLFAFFVVMYAISSVNEGKYRVLSDTLDAAFRAPERSANLVNIGEQARAPIVSPNAEFPGAQVGGPEQEGTPRESATPGDGAGREFEKRPEVMAQKVREALSDLVKKGMVVVTQGGEWVEVEMKSQVLFDSGSARVKDEALPALGEVARMLGRFENRLQVEGYTDNAPIRTAVFSSNWELSAARAASVVQLLSRTGVAPERMAAVGYGEYRPKASNDTPQGRQQNRRVVIRISTTERGPPPGPAGAGTPGTAPAPRSTQPGAQPGTQTPVPEAEAAARGTAPDGAGEKPAAQDPAAPAPEAKAREQGPLPELETVRTRPEPEGLEF
ncbi:MAG: flagellar motor protein MotD [Gammaproteobacteria bacterium]